MLDTAIVVVAAATIVIITGPARTDQCWAIRKVGAAERQLGLALVLGCTLITIVIITVIVVVVVGIAASEA